MNKIYRCIMILVLFLTLSSCSNAGITDGCKDGSLACTQSAEETASAIASVPTQTSAPARPEHITIAMDDAIQSGYRTELAQRSDVQFVDASSDADVQISIYDEQVDKLKPGAIAEWMYVVVVPFSYPVQSVDLRTVQKAWEGIHFSLFKIQPLLVSPETAAYFSVIWGKPNAHSVEIMDADELLPYAQENPGSWALLPFEALTPQWRVLRVGDMYPLSRDLDRDAYPLTARYFIQTQTNGVPAREFVDTNLHLDKLTGVLLTGTTAFVRHLAYQMETNGMEFAIDGIKQEFLNSDIRHLSNEVPMFVDCPPAVPLRVEMRFCSNPEYIHLFKLLDISFVELSGNHELDWDVEPFMETLALYRQNNIPYVGGGEDLEDAEKPLLLSDHGNNFVFFSCNAVGPEWDYAGKTRPGSAPCDFEQMAADIADYRAQGYIPIVLLQHLEVETIYPHSYQLIDFNALADAGAVIVSGSQAHEPQTFALNGDALLHYGLGNTFFDQIQEPYRYAMMDRHYFYNGRYIGTQIIPVEVNRDYQTVLMPDEDQPAFLEKILSEMK